MGIAKIAYDYLIEIGEESLNVGHLDKMHEIAERIWGEPIYSKGNSIYAMYRTYPSRIMRAIKHTKEGQKYFDTVTKTIYNGVINAPVITARIKEDIK